MKKLRILFLYALSTVSLIAMDNNEELLEQNVKKLLTKKNSFFSLLPKHIQDDIIRHLKAKPKEENYSKSSYNPCWGIH